MLKFSIYTVNFSKKSADILLNTWTWSHTHTDTYTLTHICAGIHTHAERERNFLLASISLRTIPSI